MKPEKNWSSRATVPCFQGPANLIQPVAGNGRTHVVRRRPPEETRLKPWSKTSVIYRFLWMSKYLHMYDIYIYTQYYIYHIIYNYIYYISYHMYLFIYIYHYTYACEKILSKQHIHIRSEPQHNCDGGSRWGGTGGSRHPGDFVPKHQLIWCWWWWYPLVI